MRVLTWNLYGGRAVPAARRSLQAEFAAALAGWEWDVALLQEIPPWWPPQLAQVTGAEPATVFTARNWGRAVRRRLGERDPDLWGSWAGGANSILVRGLGVEEHRRHRLRLWPERRWMHGVRLGDGTWVVNMHAHARDPEQRDLSEARAVALGWSAGAPLVFGGDVNQREPRVPELAHVGGLNVDHLFVRGLAPVGPVERLDRGRLSDHVPLAVELEPVGGAQ